MMGSFAFTAHWVSVAPRGPDFDHYVAHDEHGSVTYFTSFQHSAHLTALFGGLLVFFLAFQIVPKRNISYRTGFLGWRMTADFDDPEGVRYWAWPIGFALGAGITLLIDPGLAYWLIERARS
jgi:hypothetical protein